MRQDRPELYLEDSSPAWLRDSERQTCLEILGKWLRVSARKFFNAWGAEVHSLSSWKMGPGILRLSGLQKGKEHKALLLNLSPTWGPNLDGGGPSGVPERRERGSLVKNSGLCVRKHSKHTLCPQWCSGNPSTGNRKRRTNLSIFPVHWSLRG